jgi:hypothetical protein
MPFSIDAEKVNVQSEASPAKTVSLVSSNRLATAESVPLSFLISVYLQPAPMIQDVDGSDPSVNSKLLESARVKLEKIEEERRVNGDKVGIPLSESPLLVSNLHTCL